MVDFLGEIAGGIFLQGFLGEELLWTDDERLLRRHGVRLGRTQELRLLPRFDFLSEKRPRRCRGSGRLGVRLTIHVDWLNVFLLNFSRREVLRVAIHIYVKVRALTFV